MEGRTSGIVLAAAALVWLVALADFSMRLPDFVTVWNLPIGWVVLTAAACVIAWIATSRMSQTARTAGRFAIVACAFVEMGGLVLLAALGDEQELFGWFDQEWIWWYAYLLGMAVVAVFAVIAGAIDIGWSRTGWWIAAIGAIGQSVVGLAWTLSLGVTTPVSMDSAPIFAAIFGAGALAAGVACIMAAARRLAGGVQGT